MATSTIRVFIDQCSGFLNSFRSCRSTGKPSPPRMIAMQIGMQIHGSDTNPIRLSVYSANPALLKDDTAWKTACQAARPTS